MPRGPRVNLMDALRRSIQNERPVGKKGKAEGHSAIGEAEGGLMVSNKSNIPTMSYVRLIHLNAVR
jgi:hypothetical protein